MALQAIGEIFFYIQPYLHDIKSTIRIYIISPVQFQSANSVTITSLPCSGKEEVMKKARIISCGSKHQSFSNHPP